MLTRIVKLLAHVYSSDVLCRVLFSALSIQGSGDAGVPSDMLSEFDGHEQLA